MKNKKITAFFSGFRKFFSLSLEFFFWGGGGGAGEGRLVNSKAFTHTDHEYSKHIHTSICVVQTTIPSFDQQATVLALDHAVSIFARLLLRN